jgi:hypothetical protein
MSESTFSGVRWEIACECMSISGIKTQNLITDKMSKENENLNEAEKSALNIADVSKRFSKEDLWDAWWASAIKTISFSGVDKDYERGVLRNFMKTSYLP